MRKSHFDEALGDLVRDVAYGEAIRHLTAIGYTPSQIKEQLGYPVSLQIIGNMMLKNLFDTGKLLSAKPEDDTIPTDEKFVCDVDKLGRKSYRKVVSQKDPINEEDYIEIDFSQMKKDSPKKYEELIQALSSSDADYVDNIPWPLGILYHYKDERMVRIGKVLQSLTDKN